jgi:ketosteroid isomerase-like protein
MQVDTELNRARIEQMYSAAKRGDLEGFFAVISPDVVVTEPQFLPYGGSYRSIDELAGLFAEVTQLLDLPNLTVDHLIADGDHVLGLIRVPIIGQDSEVTLAELSIIRDGKVAEMRIYFHDAGTLALRSPANRPVSRTP